MSHQKNGRRLGRRAGRGQTGQGFAHRGRSWCFNPEGDWRPQWEGRGQIGTSDSGGLVEAELEGAMLETSEEAAAGAVRERRRRPRLTDGEPSRDVEDPWRPSDRSDEEDEKEKGGAQNLFVCIQPAFTEGV